MLRKGSMQNTKKYAGVTILILGGCLILLKDRTIDILTKYNIIVGIVLIGLGYLNSIAGRRQ